MADLDTGSPGAASAPESITADSTPMTMDRAFDEAIAEVSAGDSAPPDPGTSDPTAPAPVPATGEQPPPTTDPAALASQQTDKKVGVPPETEWPRILDNARTKSRDETIAQIRTEIAPQIEVVNRLRQNFTGTMDQMIGEGLADPNLGGPLLAVIARHLSARRGKGQALVTDEPQPDLQTQDGDPVYSARAQAEREAWLKQQMLAEVDQRIAPFQEERQQKEAVRQARAYIDQKTQEMTPTAQTWERQPHFKEHRAAILTRQRELSQQGHEPWSALGIAYAEIVNSQVLPSLQTQTQQSLVQQAAAKMRGSTDNPAASASARARPIRSVDDAFAQALEELGMPAPTR